MYQKEFMLEAEKMASYNLDLHCGGPFGAVVVKDGQIVGVGFNQVIARHDPTAHGEIVAIRVACTNLMTHDLSGCELYTNAYPCPMCLSAIIWANIKTVYYGVTQLDAAEVGFRDDLIYKCLEDREELPKLVRLEQHDREEMLRVFRAYAADEEKAKY